MSFTVAIEPQHRDLVQGDSKFVVNSRVDVKVGLDGVEFLGASASEWIDGGIRILRYEREDEIHLPALC